MNCKETGQGAKDFRPYGLRGLVRSSKAGVGYAFESHGTVTGTYDPGRGSTPVLVGEVSRVLIHLGSMSLIRS